MTCKDCIGYKFCSRGENGLTDFYGKEIACGNVEDLCQDFQNKADFAEVVRCKNCAKKVDYKDRVMCSKNARVICGELCGLTATSDEHFCGYGERINQ